MIRGERVREKHLQCVAVTGRNAGSHDEDDLYDLCEEVGVLEVVRCADYKKKECHNVIEAGVIECLGGKSRGGGGRKK